MSIIVLSIWILFLAAFVMTKVVFPGVGTGRRKLRHIRGDRVYGDDGYDSYGFSALGFHRNGTRYDDEGYDRHGLDKDGNTRPEHEETYHHSPDMDRTVPASNPIRTKVLATVMVAITVVLLGITVFDYSRNNTCMFGHVYVKTLCEVPEECGKCGKTRGEASGHQWMEADCDQPDTCSFCRATQGEPLGHDTDSGKCGRCGKMVK